MAGLFDDFTQTASADPALLEKALKAQRAQNRQRFVSGAADKGQQLGRQMVAGLMGLAELGAFGEGLKEKFNADTPELERARQDAALAKQVQELDGDPSSADFASRAAVIARDAGRPDLALRYAEAAGVRKRAEAALAAETAAAQKDAYRKQFSALPTAAQEEAIAAQPGLLTDFLDLDPAEAEQISAQVAERNEFKRMEARAKMNNVKKATATKVTGPDRDATSTLLGRYGIDTSSFGWGGEEEFNQFNELMAGETRKRVDAARDRGERLTDAEAADQIMQELQANGSIKMEDKWFGDSKNIEIVDETGFGSVFGVSAPSGEAIIDLSGE